MMAEAFPEDDAAVYAPVRRPAGVYLLTLAIDESEPSGNPEPGDDGNAGAAEDDYERETAPDVGLHRLVSVPSNRQAYISASGDIFPRFLNGGRLVAGGPVRVVDAVQLYKKNGIWIALRDDKTTLPPVEILDLVLNDPSDGGVVLTKSFYSQLANHFSGEESTNPLIRGFMDFLREYNTMIMRDPMVTRKVASMYKRQGFPLPEKREIQRDSFLPLWYVGNGPGVYNLEPVSEDEQRFLREEFDRRYNHLVATETTLRQQRREYVKQTQMVANFETVYETHRARISEDQRIEEPELSPFQARFRAYLGWKRSDKRLYDAFMKDFNEFRYSVREDRYVTRGNETRALDYVTTSIRAYVLRLSTVQGQTETALRNLRRILREETWATKAERQSLESRIAMWQRFKEAQDNAVTDARHLLELLTSLTGAYSDLRTAYNLLRASFESLPQNRLALCGPDQWYRSVIVYRTCDVGARLEDRTPRAKKTDMHPIEFLTGKEGEPTRALIPVAYWNRVVSIDPSYDTQPFQDWVNQTLRNSEEFHRYVHRLYKWNSEHSSLETTILNEMRDRRRDVMFLPQLRAQQAQMPPVLQNKFRDVVTHVRVFT